MTAIRAATYWPSVAMKVDREVGTVIAGQVRGHHRRARRRAASHRAAPARRHRRQARDTLQVKRPRVVWNTRAAGSLPAYGPTMARLWPDYGLSRMIMSGSTASARRAGSTLATATAANRTSGAASHTQRVGNAGAGCDSRQPSRHQQRSEHACDRPGPGEPQSVGEHLMQSSAGLVRQARCAARFRGGAAVRRRTSRRTGREHPAPATSRRTRRRAPSRCAPARARSCRGGWRASSP